MTLKRSEPLAALTANFDLFFFNSKAFSNCRLIGIREMGRCALLYSAVEIRVYLTNTFEN